MAFFIAFLTLIMVLDCVVLVLLVLIQLPKKEAGAGLAFGGGASDALFGAGSGTVLTKITRWAATAFFILAVGLAMLQSRFHSRTTSKFEQQLGQTGRPAAAMPATPSAPAPQPAAPLSTTPAPLTGSNVLLTPQPEAATAPAVPPPSAGPVTNPAVPK